MVAYNFTFANDGDLTGMKDQVWGNIRIAKQTVEKVACEELRPISLSRSVVHCSVPGVWAPYNITLVHFSRLTINTMQEDSGKTLDRSHTLTNGSSPWANRCYHPQVFTQPKMPEASWKNLRQGPNMVISSEVCRR